MHTRRTCSTRGSNLSQSRDCFIHGSRLDDHIALYDSGDWYYFHADAQFTTLAMTMDDVDPPLVVERYVSDPYGKTVVYNPNWTGARSKSNK